jgi:hypothetical protein
MIAQGSMSSFAKQREAAVSMVLLPQASGQGGAGVLRQAVGQVDEALGPSQIAEVGVGTLGDGPAGGIREITQRRCLDA